MIVDLCPYWTNPTTGGGPERVHNLCKGLSIIDEVTELSMRPTLTMMKRREIPFGSSEIRVNPNYRELRLTHLPVMLSSKIASLFAMPEDLFISDACIMHMPKRIDDILENATAFQVEHPWQFRYAKTIVPDNRKIILSTHNCETKLARLLSRKSQKQISNRVMKKVAEIEKDALNKADHIIAVSEEDLEDFKNYLDVDVEGKSTIAPNGVNCELTKRPSMHEKMQARESIGVGPETLAIFLGSRHRPNLEAVDEILKNRNAYKRAGVKIIVIGSVGEGFRDTDMVTFTSHVADYRIYLKAADIALNPLSSGSGTSLKVLEFLAAGIPLITTEVGSRGLDLTNNENAMIVESEKFPETIAILSEDSELREKLGQRGRTLVEDKYDWNIIGRELADRLSGILMG